VDYTTTENRDTFAVLADLAQAMQDAARRPKLLDDPATEVEGFERLPSDLQETFKAMSAQEMAVVGRVHAVLLENGFFVQNGNAREDLPLRLSMF
jgi:hypothetical protein